MAERRCLELQQDRHGPAEGETLALSQRSEVALDCERTLRDELDDARSSIDKSHESLAAAEGALQVAEQEKAELLARLEAMSTEMASPGTSKEAEQAVREDMERELEATKEALRDSEARTSAHEDALTAAQGRERAAGRGRFHCIGLELLVCWCLDFAFVRRFVACIEVLSVGSLRSRREEASSFRRPGGAARFPQEHHQAYGERARGAARARR